MKWNSAISRCWGAVLLGGLLLPAWQAAAEDAALDAYLADCRPHYSDKLGMLGQKFRSPGYHTTVPNGTWVHPTLQSLDYAVGLLARNAPGDADRAAKIIRKVLTLQDTDPESRTYGIWPWLLEEPLDKMSPPDWNWADFCGARIAQMLVEHRAKLPDDLVEAMRTSLGHAARAIRRRNVGPGYTNIAIMGGGVCAAAGELLGDAGLLEYGRDRLQRTVKHAEHHGSFNEYNSPTYTMVALYEAERTLQLVRDPATRAAAESLRHTAWRIIADSYNPGTGQWGGPHSRVYGDLVSSNVTGYLADQTGLEIGCVASGARPRCDGIRHLPCPKELVARFRKLPSDPLELRRQFIRGATPEKSTVGTTWHTADACLGSINHATFWTQRRGLIGYWKTDEDPAVVLRLRFLHDGRDFASMAARIEQRGSRALSVFYPVARRGDWHPSLDRPEDGVFQATDFRVRYQLSGKGVRVEPLDSDRFALVAGDRRVVVHTVPGRFAGQAVVWQSGRQRDIVFVDGVCYRGPKRAFDFRKLPEVVLAAGIELLGTGEAPAAERPKVAELEPGHVEATWALPGGEPIRVKAP